MAHVNGQWLDFDELGALLNAAAQELVAAGVVRPLDRADGAAVRLWRDMDLCAVLEPAFGEAPDPSALSTEERKAGWRRLSGKFTSPHFEHETPHWLLHEGQPVGTIALAQMLRGPNLVSIDSLYVLPAHRGRGVSTRALRACQVDVSDHWISHHGMATFSLALAVAGWPLIRSPEMYQEHHHDESGPPEALAYRIEWYEALAHRDGWRVETPRISGLSYRSYAELRGAEAEE